jgi:hypothetical protein
VLLNGNLVARELHNPRLACIALWQWQWGQRNLVVCKSMLGTQNTMQVPMSLVLQFFSSFIHYFHPIISVWGGRDFHFWT